MKKAITSLLILVSVCSLAETLYVRPNGGAYGTENGSSWANAFDGLSDVTWGSGAGNLGAGDTLYVAAGTYTQQFVAGGSGSSGSPITIAAAQDTHTGTATFSAGVLMNMNAQSFITMNGSYNGATNFVFANMIGGQNANSCKWLYFFLTNAPVDLRFAGSNEVAYATIDLGSSEDWAINGEGSDNGVGYNQSYIHNVHVIIPGRWQGQGAGEAGIGPDGIKPGRGFTIYSNVLQAIVATTTSTEHQDLIQFFGNNYSRVFANEFIDSGDAQLGIDNGGSAVSYYQIYNNVFRRTVDNMGTVMLRIYTSSGTIGSFTDVAIDNNTFIDGTRTYVDYGAAIRLHAGSGSTTSSGCSIRNNIIYNCGDSWSAILIQDITDNWSFSHNLVNAGSQGNAAVSGWTQTSGQSGVPAFTSYTAYSLANNLRLASGDTSAKNNGTTVSLFSVDKDSVTRPQGASWDIGAYEYASGESPATGVWNIGTLIIR